MTPPFLNTLVQLASLGASGICIFAVFWIGFLLRYPPRAAVASWHTTVTKYMRTCIVIAIISAVSGVANSLINASTIGKLRVENATLNTTVAQNKGQLEFLRKEVAMQDKMLVEAIALAETTDTSENQKVRLNEFLKSARSAIKDK